MISVNRQGHPSPSKLPRLNQDDNDLGFTAILSACEKSENGEEEQKEAQNVQFNASALSDLVKAICDQTAASLNLSKPKPIQPTALDKFWLDTYLKEIPDIVKQRAKLLREVKDREEKLSKLKESFSQQTPPPGLKLKFEPRLPDCDSQKQFASAMVDIVKKAELDLLAISIKSKALTITEKTQAVSELSMGLLHADKIANFTSEFREKARQSYTSKLKDAFGIDDARVKIAHEATIARKAKQAEAAAAQDAAVQLAVANNKETIGSIVSRKVDQLADQVAIVCATNTHKDKDVAAVAKFLKKSSPQASDDNVYVVVDDTHPKNKHPKNKTKNVSPGGGTNTHANANKKKKRQTKSQKKQDQNSNPIPKTNQTTKSNKKNQSGQKPEGNKQKKRSKKQSTKKNQKGSGKQKRSKNEPGQR